MSQKQEKSEHDKITSTFQSEVEELKNLSRNQENQVPNVHFFE